MVKNIRLCERSHERKGHINNSSLCINYLKFRNQNVDINHVILLTSFKLTTYRFYESLAVLNHAVVCRSSLIRIPLPGLLFNQCEEIYW